MLLLPWICAAVAGPWAAVVAVGAMMIAKALVEGFNYFQHFGLIRVEGAPIQLHHAWNHLGMIVRPLGSEITNTSTITSTATHPSINSSPNRLHRKCLRCFCALRWA